MTRLAIFALLLSLAAPALAQPEDNPNRAAAQATFQAGEKAFAAGEYVTAARSFEASHRLVPHYNAIDNAALAWVNAGKPGAAADALTLALALPDITAEERADSEARLAAIRPGLVLVRVLGAPGALIDLEHAEQRPTPADIFVTPGAHDVVIVYADKRKETRHVDAEPAGGELRINLDAAPVKPLPPPPPAVPAPVPNAPGDAGGGLWIAGWVVTGLAVGAGAAAIGLGVAALDARDRFEASGNTDAEAHDDAAALRTATNVTWALAGAAAVGGVVLLVLGGTAEESPAASFELTPAGLRLRGRF